MPSSPTSPSPFRSPIDRRLGLGLGAVLAVGGAGCDDDDPTCGTGGAPATGLVATGDQVTLTYGGLSSLSGNDCPDPGAPVGVISLSIEGQQTDGAGLVTLCIPRPDLLIEGMRGLGHTTSMADVRIVDFTGAATGCTFKIDRTAPPTGAATAEGVCANGTDPAGFALTLDGGITLERTCGATVDTVTVTLAGRVAVTSRD